MQPSEQCSLTPARRPVPEKAMSQRVVYFSGQYVPESEARVSIFDSALMFGDMAFEMTRTYNQRPYKLREHLERLYGSLRLMEIDGGLFWKRWKRERWRL